MGWYLRSKPVPAVVLPVTGQNRSELIFNGALHGAASAQGEGQHVAQRVIRRVAVLGLDAVAEDHYARLFTDLRHPIEVTTH